ncbi:hypothetical protein [Marinobacter fonticola]|uniref:hypothetical protein n=1 Tax=Marinobacter fonticola TaxID=2603215 RepID=UPI0011E82BBD|nr:hypothetical protein [Marinobacter fonticola]
MKKKYILIACMVATVGAGTIHAEGTEAKSVTKTTLSEKSTQSLKKQHRIMTRSAASEVGMEARRQLMLSKKDELYHELVESGDIELSSTDRFALDQFSH